jgi:prepilin-type N-terminal cleavage/methylation domain-containing protein
MKVASSEGFTLIEVLIAMVILSIGLLGLEALGIGAARANAVAERQSRHAVIGADSLESALHQLRQGVLPSQFCQTDLPYGDRLSRQVDVSNPRLIVVTVSVLSNEDSPNPPPEDFVATSSLYLPSPISGTPPGSPCG